MSTISFPRGAELPQSRLGLPGAGDLSTATVTIILATRKPGGATVATVTGIAITKGTDQITVDWSSADLGSLAEGSYGITVTATKSGKDQKWTGTVAIRAAS